MSNLRIKLTREQWRKLSRLAKMAAGERGQDAGIYDAVGALAEWRARIMQVPAVGADQVSQSQEPLPEWLAEIEAILNIWEQAGLFRPRKAGVPELSSWRRLLELCLAQRRALVAVDDWGVSGAGRSRRRADRLWEGK